MRFLIVDAVYPSFLKNFYSRFPGYGELSYRDGQSLLMNECVGIADGYSAGLKELGHQAEEVIINDQLLQMRWALENGLPVRGRRSLLNSVKDLLKKGLGRNIYGSLKQFAPDRLKASAADPWMLKVLFGQVKKYRPDVLLIHTVKEVNEGFLKLLRPYVKLIIGQHASPLVPGMDFGPYDLMLSSLPNYVELFRREGKRSQYFRLGFNDKVLGSLRHLPGAPFVVHIGGYGEAHNERNNFLEKVAKGTRVDFWGFGTENLDKKSAILGSYHGQAWGLERLNIFYSAKIVLTKHAYFAGNFANNMTLYEATGSGALLIADNKDNINDLFEVGKEIAVYNNPQECLELIKYYLSHEEERAAIALAGQKRTLKEHTYGRRMKELLGIVNKYI
ncbi:MAG: glycosyltransferase [Candidatus Omnitrophota bacterium]